MVLRDRRPVGAIEQQPAIRRCPLESVEVEIFGQSYHIKGKDDPAYIRELAAFVDARMKEVQKATGTPDPHRVAILTVLTLSDELYRVREQLEGLRSATEQSLERLLALTEAAGR